MEKKKVGRPARAKGEKMERLSVVIQKRYRDALGLIARDRQTSLSQAIEYVIAVVARDYKIEDKTVKDIIAGDDVLETIMWSFLPESKAEKEESKREFKENIKKLREVVLSSGIVETFSKTKLANLLNIPESVRSPEEKYIATLFDRFGDKIGLSKTDNFYDFASQEYRAGTPIEELEKRLSEAFNKKEGA